MRTLEAYKNIKYSAFTYVANCFLKFAARIVFVKCLPIDYLGINGLFTNLIMLLSVADLGVGTAVVYNLYKPIADKNIESIKSLMCFLKKAYIFIGCTIIFIGILFIPHLNFFIKNSESITNLQYIYLIFLLNTGVSYFWSYKRLLLIADQKSYINSFFQLLFQCILNIAQIIVLITWSNYYIYVTFFLVITIFENMVVSRKVDRMYPFLNEGNELPLTDTLRVNIKKNVKAIILQRIGSIIEFSCSNLVIAKFIGLATLGIYSNYNMVIWTIETGVWQVMSSVTSSIGNLIVVEDQNKKVRIYKILEFLNGWLATIIMVGLYVLLNDFIELWVGKEYLLNENIVVWLIISFYVTFMRKAVLIFKDASGLFWNDRYKNICYALLNLGLSIILANNYGVLGVIWGWMISTLLTCFWVEPYVLFNSSINMKIKDYYKNYFRFAVVTILTAISIKHLYKMLFDKVTINSFVFGVILCLLISNVIWILVFRKRDEMCYLSDVIREKIGRIFL